MFDDVTNVYWRLVQCKLEKRWGKLRKRTNKQVALSEF